MWFLKKWVEVDPTKIEAINNWPKPTNVSEVHSFLSLDGYYRYFISRFFKLSLPLTYLTRKDVNLFGMRIVIKVSRIWSLSWHHLLFLPYRKVQVALLCLVMHLIMDWGLYWCNIINSSLMPRDNWKSMKRIIQLIIWSWWRLCLHWRYIEALPLWWKVSNLYVS